MEKGTVNAKERIDSPHLSLFTEMGFYCFQHSPPNSLCAGWQPTSRIQTAATMEPGGGIEPPHVRSIVRGCCFRFCFCTRHMSPAAGGCRRVGEKGVIVRAYCPHSHCRIDSICNCAIWHSSQHFINIRLNFMLLFPFVPAKLIQPHMIIIGDQF